MSSFQARHKACTATVVLVTLVVYLLNTMSLEQSMQCIDKQSSLKTDFATDLPIIYGITPTYARFTQEPDLTRLAQTLMLVKNFHWIVVEDSLNKTQLVTDLLENSGLQFTHLEIESRLRPKHRGKGVDQRNKGLDWLRNNTYMHGPENGIVYFMDDDNTYSLRVFDEMRKIKRVGVWPVGLAGGMKIETALVKSGKVVGFNAIWKPERPFPIDMAGFAINLSLIKNNPLAKFSINVSSQGYQESDILKQLTKVEDLEPLAKNCTKVFVWHTQTKIPKITRKE